jgi:hypothetical protein
VIIYVLVGVAIEINEMAQAVTMRSSDTIEQPRMCRDEVQYELATGTAQ